MRNRCGKLRGNACYLVAPYPRRLFNDAGNTVILNIAIAIAVEHAGPAVVALPHFAPARASIRQIKALNPDIIIAACADQSIYEAHLRHAGVDLVVVPELAGADTRLRGALDMPSLPR